MAVTGPTATPLRSTRARATTLPTGAGGPLHVVRLGPQGRAEVPAGWTSAWLPIAGALDVEAGGHAWTLPRHEVLVWRDGPVRGRAARAALLVAGPHAAWRAPPAGATEALEPPLVLPTEQPVSPALRRAALRLARSAGDPSVHGRLDDRLAAFAAALREQQFDLRARLPRCTGRTAERREHTMLRLLRVQHLIRRHSDGRLDTARMARCASYSPCHLIRLYREVFDETPAEYAARLRDERAWQLVRDTALPVAAITDALGFESASAFCRAFKASFGVTATQARRAATAACAEAA